LTIMSSRALAVWSTMDLILIADKGEKKVFPMNLKKQETYLTFILEIVYKRQ